MPNSRFQIPNKPSKAEGSVWKVSIGFVWRLESGICDLAIHGGGKDGWFGPYMAMKERIKQQGSGREWFAGDGRISRMTSSKSPARKFASAMIARIPLPLARHIARVYRPC